MLINPVANHHLQAFPGTRLLVHDFGLVGVSLNDPIDKGRIWTIQALFEPVPRCLGGIRARCLDQKNFVSFIDQMSLEVLLGLGVPSTECIWADRLYPSPKDRDWFGFCADPVDMIDDLYMRELMLRTDQSVLPQGMELTRLVHVDRDNDVRDLLILAWDGDQDTGISPDVRMGTIDRRWMRVERERLKWSHI